ncbi:putative dynein heavy chain [Trypanosoma cruzi]|uniref:Putative dynein heavy chain n=1 Tax=Trypanosoma cruzi TaxID=5693 RepID=A0A2V2VJ18_TRYCR|nr:putative dynein heavy chain [Trypanosoma cruzi]
MGKRWATTRTSVCSLPPNCPTKFTPEMFAKSLVIDFTVTMEGLEQQLLSHVIGREKAELNEESAKLSEDINSNEKRRKNLEDRLLKQLSESQGNLIDDVGLIQTLQETKDASAEIAEKLTTALETKKRIAGACEEYRPVAHVVRCCISLWWKCLLSVTCIRPHSCSLMISLTGPFNGRSITPLHPNVFSASLNTSPWRSLNISFACSSRSTRYCLSY